MDEQKKIKNRVEKIKQKIEQLSFELADIREQCKHPNLITKHGADRGNYDPSLDRYWIDYKCPDCGKFWTQDVS